MLQYESLISSYKPLTPILQVLWWCFLYLTRWSQSVDCFQITTRTCVPSLNLLTEMSRGCNCLLLSLRITTKFTLYRWWKLWHYYCHRQLWIENIICKTYASFRYIKTQQQIRNAREVGNGCHILVFSVQDSLILYKNN